MSYTRNTNFTAKDLLAPGAEGKTILGEEIQIELDEIAACMANLPTANDGTLTGTTTVVDLTVTGDAIIGGDSSTNNIGGANGTTTIDGDVVFSNGSVTGARPNVITDSTTARTLALTDETAVIVFSNASAKTVTIPANATVACPIGFICHLYQQNTGQITVAPAGGVTLNSSLTLKTRDQYSTLSLVKIAEDSWYLIGDMAAA